MRAAKTVIHPLYTASDSGLEYDIALVLLPQPVVDVAIPSLPGPKHELEVGSRLVVVGWGDEGSRAADVLQMGLGLEVVSNAVCPWDLKEHALCLFARGVGTPSPCNGNVQGEHGRAAV